MNKSKQRLEKRLTDGQWSTLRWLAGLHSKSAQGYSSLE